MLKKLIPIMILALSFFSCDLDDSTKIGDGFDPGLVGEWTSNDTSEPWASGGLIFTADTVTITGYLGTAPTGQINNHPFRGYTKNAALEGYSMDGKIYIHDGGIWQPGIPYTVYGTPPAHHLRLVFGNRNENLDWVPPASPPP
jgi:hypothetical protein